MSQNQVHRKNLDRRGPAWRVAQSGHTCGWPGCEKFVAGRLWGCREHWLLVPVELRDAWMAAGAGSARVKGLSVIDRPAVQIVHECILAEVVNDS